MSKAIMGFKNNILKIICDKNTFIKINDFIYTFSDVFNIENINVSEHKFEFTTYEEISDTIEKISRIFESAKFEYSYYDSFLGQEVGSSIIMQGYCYERTIRQHCSKRAFELLFEITNSTPDKFNLVYNSEEDNYVEYNNIPF